MMSACSEGPIVDTRMALGRQVTLECYDCNRGILADPARMEQIFLEAAHKSGATVISSHFHAFEPQGISGVVIISESHFAVHAWPEYDYAAVDIFTCGESIDFDVATATIRDGLLSGRTIISSLMNRGIVNNQGVERMMTVCEDQVNSYSLSWKSRFERTHAHGISASIDLYECSLNSLDLAAIVQGLGELLRRECNLEPVGKVHTYSGENGMIALRLNLIGGMLSGHIDLEQGSVYLDIFGAEYFEPRIAAEAALASFKGHHYRMQIAIRQ